MRKYLEAQDKDRYKRSNRYWPIPSVQKLLTSSDSRDIGEIVE